MFISPAMPLRVMAHAEAVTHRCDRTSGRMPPSWLIQELEVCDEGSQTEQVLAEQPRQPDWVYRPASLQDWVARSSTQERKCR